MGEQHSGINNNTNFLRIKKKTFKRFHYFNEIHIDISAMILKVLLFALIASAIGSSAEDLNQKHEIAPTNSDLPLGAHPLKDALETEKPKTENLALDDVLKE